jgi:hypothetical protein
MSATNGLVYSLCRWGMMSLINNDSLEFFGFESADSIGMLQGLPGSNNARGVSVERSP